MRPGQEIRGAFRVETRFDKRHAYAVAKHGVRICDSNSEHHWPAAFLFGVMIRYPIFVKRGCHG
ncbi:hypothetical protein GCM10027615_15610 [Plantactinospora veratri]